MSAIESSSHHNAKVDDIDLGKILGIIIDHKISIIATIILATIIGIIKAMTATPIYQADSLIQVEQKTGGLSSMLGITDELSQESSTTAEIELIKSRMVLGETVDHLKLTTVITPEYTPFIGESLARIQDYHPELVLQSFKTLSDRPIYLTIDNAYKGTFTLKDKEGHILSQGKVGDLIQAENFKLQVSQLYGEADQVFSIYKQSRRNAIVQLQNALSIYEKGKGTGMLVLTMTSPFPKFNEKVLHDVASNYVLQNVSRKSEEAENGLEFASKQIIDVKEKLTKAEDKLNAYRIKNGAINLNTESDAALNTIITLESQLSELKFKEAELAKRFTKEHPSYIALLDKRNYLLQQKAKFERQIKKMPQSQQDILRLTRNVEVNQQIYMQLLNKAQELRLVKAGTVGNVRIVDDAESNPTPIAPRKKLIVILSTFVGLILGLAQAFIRSAFHRGVDNPEQIEAIGLPVYASVPLSEGQIRQNKKNPSSVNESILAVSNPADLSIEALRSLRTSLHFAMMESKNNILMISGPSPGIGKSFISANMATVIAQSGQRVLLIDADMRKGYLASQMCVKSNTGLSDFLCGKSEKVDIVQQTSINNVNFIAKGVTPPNPSELLMHPRFEQLLGWASEHYDLVLIDTPPILAVTDAAIIGAHAGTSLLVSRFDKTQIKELEITLQRFEQNGVVIKGCIFNAVERKASSYYGNYGYYNYSYSSES
ncbi:polysaccharide biosynthesis tyrosine autokinase [Photobacterium leiognathi]|uniref:polysaccharide biosynthesis tyrosine autokinase n=1 Tax=Photobacterium leiognathi TaxID=553611 RepID=UPI002739EE39|nr:polysaccharide biosynthesis tyrosine autokinase [Photobacterium leiognathi]